MDRFRLLKDSQHMIVESRWFSSLAPVTTKEYITFKDNSHGKIQSAGTLMVNEKIVLKEAPINNQQTDKLSIMWVLFHQFKSYYPQHNPTADSGRDISELHSSRSAFFSSGTELRSIKYNPDTSNAYMTYISHMSDCCNNSECTNFLYLDVQAHTHVQDQCNRTISPLGITLKANREVYYGLAALLIPLQLWI